MYMFSTYMMDSAKTHLDFTKMCVIDVTYGGPSSCSFTPSTTVLTQETSSGRDGLEAAGHLHDVRNKQQSGGPLDGFYGNQEALQRNVVLHWVVGQDVGPELHTLAPSPLQNEHLQNARIIKLKPS